MKLTFGTGGIRAVRGEGEDQFNAALVRCVSRGIAAHLLQKHGERAKTDGVVVAYDTRIDSDVFARCAALAFAEAGIKAYLFDQYVPTPTLSFAITQLHCAAGVMLTASHNTMEYNGYKAYNEQGYQMTTMETRQVSEQMARASDAPIDTSAALPWLTSVPAAVIEAYLAAVSAQALLLDDAAKRNIRVLYTPLFGTGYQLVPQTLSRNGFDDVHIVSAQAYPDGNFPNLISPNPEERSALNLAIEEAKAIHADLVIGTDPDCDRVGCAVLHGQEYQLISGNQMGGLLMRYILTQKEGSIPTDGAVIKTIVTNDLGAELARNAGLTVFETLTGFKYIGEMMVEFRRIAQNKTNAPTEASHTFVFGYEESYGYLVGDYTHDKDAVVSSLLICEMAAYYRRENKTLVDALNELYETLHHYYADAQDTLKIDAARQALVMQAFRTKPVQTISPDAKLLDYQDGLNDLERSNVLKYIFSDQSWVALRPSGTEPKLKIYYCALGKTTALAADRLSDLRTRMNDICNEVMGLSQ